jgi:hypothetical protein
MINLGVEMGWTLFNHIDFFLFLGSLNLVKLMRLDLTTRHSSQALFNILQVDIFYVTR